MRGAFADRQLKHIHEAARPEARGLFAGGDDLGGSGLIGALG